MNDTRYGYSEKAKTERKRILKNDFICKKMKQIHRQLCKINDEFIYSK